MILVEETKAQFGYDPRELTLGSHAKVLRKCDGCSEIKAVENRQTGRLCSPCHMREVAMGLVYSPEEAERAHARDLWKKRQRSKLINSTRIEAPCIQCGVRSLRPIRSYKTHPCKDCQNTKNSERWELVKSENRSKGLTATGIPFEEMIERSRKHQTKWHTKARQSPVYLEKSRLRTALVKMYQRGDRSFRLPYAPAQLRQHIDHELATCRHKCPMCSVDLGFGFQIDHIVPLVTAKTVDDVAPLFALSNLSVLCPDCNQRVKRGRLVTYKSLKEGDKY